MKTSTLLPFVAILASCDNQGELVTTEPSMSEISGHYEISDYRYDTKVDNEIATKAAAASIELDEDGSVSLHNFPVVPERDDSPFILQRLHTGSGTYSIAPLGSTSKSEFYGLYMNCGDLPDPLDTPRLRSHNGTMTLSFEYFDGDFVQRLAFTRTNQTKKQNKSEQATPMKPSD